MDLGGGDIMYKQPRPSPLAHYDLHLRDLIDITLVKDFKLFKGHDFRHSHSLINLELTEAIIEKRDTNNRVF